MAGTPTKYVVRINDRSRVWGDRKISEINQALESMGNSILNSALMTAPKKYGPLRESGKVTPGQLQVKVSFGNKQVKYASYQERGERYDGTHRVRNYTTPGTGKLYLKTAGKNVVRKGLKQWLRSHY